MSPTPDRFPGPREEEKTTYSSPPTGPGEVGYDDATGQMQAWDSGGKFNMRTGGSPVDEKVKVSSNDTTPGYLNGKLVAGTGITLVEVDDGDDETLRIDADTVAPVRSIDISFRPIQIGEDSWAMLSHLIFRGTDFMGTPTHIKLATWSEDPNEPVSIRIIDVENGGAVVAQVSVTNGSVARVDMGTLANMSASETLWEFQGKHGAARWADGWLTALSVQV